MFGMWLPYIEYKNPIVFGGDHLSSTGVKTWILKTLYLKDHKINKVYMSMVENSYNAQQLHKTCGRSKMI